MGDFTLYGRGGHVPSETCVHDLQEKNRELRQEAEQPPHGPAMNGWIRPVFLTIAFVTAACSSNAPTAGAPSKLGATQEPIRGCVPACVSGLSRPGPLTTGTYQTEWFFGGEMQVTLESEWTSGEDSTGEFNAMPKATPQDAVFFWEDVYPVRHGTRV